MTTTIIEHTHAHAWQRTAAKIAIGGIILYQVLLIALIFIRPDLEPSWHTISEWAIGPYGWIMTLAFFISAISYTSLFVLLMREVRGVGGYTGLAVLAICALGTFGVGAFTTDPMTTHPEDLTAMGIAHMASGGSALMLLPLSALLINLNLARKNSRWQHARRALLITAFIPLLGLAAFMTYHALCVAPLGRYAYGPGVNIGWPPRVALFSYMIWVVTVGSVFFKRR